MHWSNLLRRLSGAARLEEVADQSAARARHAVWDRVKKQVGGMGLAEARGYVRARSAAVVHREIDRALQHDASLRGADRARLVELTTFSLIRMIADQVVFGQAATAVPAVTAQLRRAA